MRKIGLELSPSGITVGDVIQGADAVDDPGQLSVQDRVSRTISSMRVLPPSNGLFGKSAAVAGSSPAATTPQLIAPPHCPEPRPEAPQYRSRLPRWHSYQPRQPSQARRRRSLDRRASRLSAGPDRAPVAPPLLQRELAAFVVKLLAYLRA